MIGEITAVSTKCVALECCFPSIPPFHQLKPKVKPHPSISPSTNTHSYVFSRMLKLRAKDADKVRSGLALWLFRLTNAFNIYAFAWIHSTGP